MSDRYARMSFSEQCLEPTMSLHKGRFFVALQIAYLFGAKRTVQRSCYQDCESAL